jgi:hypothetical protein
MKVFFQKYKRDFWIVVSVFVVLLVFLVTRVVMALNITVPGDNRTEISVEKHWQNPEVRNLQKEIYWLELTLAKSDSISLGIHLTNSLVQVQLKGTTLFQTKILKQNPTGFLLNLHEYAYFNFAKINHIQNETANIPKKPVKKMHAPTKETEVAELKNDVLEEEVLTWSFLAGNNVKVVIHGVNAGRDTSYLIHTTRDIFAYRSAEFFQQMFPGDYSPTLFLWLDDNQAKAIYRALPEKGQVIFRN